MSKKRTIRVSIAAVTMAVTASGVGVGVGQAQATTASAAAAAAVEYWPGKDVTVGSCKGWLNQRTSDGYVQAYAQSWGHRCTFWLERKRLGPNGYDWTRVSAREDLIKGTYYYTGFHWNGTDAGSRVCIDNHDLQSYRQCGAGAW